MLPNGQRNQDPLFVPCLAAVDNAVNQALSVYPIGIKVAAK